MAVIVLCSIAAGAIVTLVRGPWMWGSLLILPAAAGLAILLLYRLNDSLLRRSLQLAILASFALHLLVLIVTSLTVIFGNSLPAEKVVVAKRPERKIVVSNKQQKFVIQQPQKHQITETQVEPEKKRETTTVKPQPVPVVEQQQKPDQQVVKKRVEQTSMPRVAKQLSRRSRSTQEVKPKPSSSVSKSEPARQQVQQPTSTPRPSETQLARRQQSQRSNADRQAPAASSKSRTPEPVLSRRKTEAAKIAERTGESVARMRSETPSIPKVVNRRSTNPKNGNPKRVERVVKSEPSAVQVARNEKNRMASQKTRTNVQTQIQPRLQSSSQRNVNRSEANLASSKSSNTTRQSTTKTPTATNAVQVAASSESASQKSAQTVPRPQNLAVSRSTAGTMGAGRSQNLDRVRGGQPSPVRIASDSSNKRRSNRMAENIAMSSLQKSTRLDRGRSESSKRVLKSEKITWSKRSGSSAPAETTLQASAANISTAIANSAQSTAAEKGSSMLDLGASKVVPELAAERRGGGGLPQLSNTLTRPTPTQSGSRTNQAPQVSQSLSGSAFNNPTDTPAEVGVEQSESANAVERNTNVAQAGASRGESQSREFESSNNASVTEIAGGPVARRESTSGESSLSDEEVENKSQFGNARDGVAQAPRVDRNVEFGSGGNREVQILEAGDSSEDVSNTVIARRATDQMTGGSLVGTASKIVASSMAGLPLLGQGAGESRRRSDREAVLDGDDRTNLSRRSLTSNLPRVDVPAGLANAVDSTGEEEQVVAENLTANDSQTASIERRAADNNLQMPAVAVQLDTEIGAGGLADMVSRRVGSVTDSITDSETLSPSRDSRFQRKEFGGMPTVAPDATLAKEAFRSRNPAALADSGPQTEAAIEAGLEFLARYQLADGSWTLGQFDNENALFQNQLNSDTAATGLALLAYQGAGYNHKQYKYAPQLQQAVAWMVANQSASGGLYIEADEASNKNCRMYSHAIAALAMAEAYGMTQDPELREPAQRALDYMVDTQDQERGGWRYFGDRRNRSTDTSVTGWMMMALKSGKLAGLEVPASSLEKIDMWLGVAEDPNAKSQFRYNPYAVDTVGKSRAHGRKASTTMTSVGLLMRVYTGWGPTDQRFLLGADALLKQLPGDSSSRERDTYYWYYATQVMKHAGGKHWEQWSKKLHPLLVGTQETSGEYRGSWHPFEPVPDRWGPQGGRLYVTTMNLLSLEVKYRLLPLYENTIK